MNVTYEKMPPELRNVISAYATKMWNLTISPGGHAPTMILKAFTIDVGILWLARLCNAIRETGIIALRGE